MSVANLPLADAILTKFAEQFLVIRHLRIEFSIIHFSAIFFTRPQMFYPQLSCPLMSIYN